MKDNKKSHKGDISVYEGEYLRLRHGEGWEYVERSNCEGAVAIIGVTEEKKVIFVEQYRRPMKKRVIEFPAGLVNDRPNHAKVDWEEEAHREFLEEAGYTASDLELLTVGPSSPGLTNELIALYLATGLKKVGPGGGDESENIVVHEIPLDEAFDWLEKKQKKGLFVDPKVFGGLYFLGRRFK